MTDDKQGEGAETAPLGTPSEGEPGERPSEDDLSGYHDDNPAAGDK